jgi:CRISPR associated protein Cas1
MGGLQGVKATTSSEQSFDVRRTLVNWRVRIAVFERVSFFFFGPLPPNGGADILAEIHWLRNEAERSVSGGMEGFRCSQRKTLAIFHDARSTPSNEQRVKLRKCDYARERNARTRRPGLDPAIGYLHALKPGRLSLAYDVIELLRPKIDLCVFNWAASRQLGGKTSLKCRAGRHY